VSTNRKNTNVWGIPSMETYLTSIMIRKKDISKKDLFYLHGIYSIKTSVLISSCNFDVEKYSLCVYVRYEYTE
jgi:hypothetical protein